MSGIYSIAKFASRTGRLGKPLPAPFPVFDMENVRFRHGATSMLAGKPGAGKSIFALNMLVAWAQLGSPIMYFSADSDEYTVARRLGGIIGGFSMDRIETMRPRELAQVLDVDYMSNIRFEYKVDRGDAAAFIAGRMNAYEAVYGSYPAVVFVDNLINYAPSATDWGGMIDLLADLDSLARETRSQVCVLHHASRGYGTAADPVPADAIQGKVDQIPRLVLTIAANETARAVACVKNTNGPQYPDATHFMTFNVHDSLRVTDNYQEMM